MLIKTRFSDNQEIIKVNYEIMLRYVLNTDLSDFEIDFHIYNLLYNKGIHTV